MKAAGWLFLALAAVRCTGAEGFVATRTPEQATAAGLGRLSPEEKAALDRQIEAYVQARKAGQADPARSAGGTRERQPGWLGALVSNQRAEDKAPGDEVVLSRLSGEFSGWDGRTKFVLENGQVWQQAVPQLYQPKQRLQSPVVKVYPGAMGYWLELPELDVRVKVKPLKLE